MNVFVDLFSRHDLVKHIPTGKVGIVLTVDADRVRFKCLGPDGTVEEFMVASHTMLVQEKSPEWAYARKRYFERLREVGRTYPGVDFSK